jgi:large subunit ribosomal protein L23
VKVVRPGKELPENEVMLHVPLKMTKLDVRNYLQSIYNVEVAKVNTRIQLGEWVCTANVSAGQMQTTVLC